VATDAHEKDTKMKTACCNPLNATNSEPVQPPLANAAGPQGSAAFGQQPAAGQPETAARITGVAPPLDSEKGKRMVSQQHLLATDKT